MSKIMWDLTLPSLKEAYKDYFLLGNILDTKDLDDPDTLAMFAHHYTIMTVENSMKPRYVALGPGNYDFSKADKLVNWALDKGIAVHGHTFIWHNQSAPWLNMNEKEEALPRDQARANMESFIREYASRYDGKIKSWDVINEAIMDKGEFSGDWKADLRQEKTPWYMAYAKDGQNGADYIYDAYRYARKYGPRATLYYNDYNEEIPPKRDAICQMVQDINAAWKKDPAYDNRLLIEGIGMQAHLNSEKSLDQVEEALKKYIQTGAVISITELDITFGEAGVLNDEEELKQARMYARLFRLFKEHAKHIERVTFWAKNDSSSWRAKGAPVLFDSSGGPKKAFYAVLHPEDPQYS